MSQTENFLQKNRLSAGFADNCGAGVPPAQDVVVEPGRRDARTTNLAESQKTKPTKKIAV